MRPEEADAAHLWDMLFHARNIARRHDRLTLERLRSDVDEQYLVSKPLELIGEAAYKVSPGYKAAHPEVPWERISGMRHRLVHDYRRVNRATVFRTATVGISELIPLLEPLVPPEPRERETASDDLG